MRLEKIADFLQNRLRSSLPGPLAHEPMRAVPSGTVLPNFNHKLSPKPGSVLILLYEKAGRIQFPLIKRPEYLGAHSGQVSLPGGKAEDHESAIETALREGEEEIGINRSAVQVLGTLSNFFVVPSNFMVTPVIGVIENPVFKADQREVMRIIQGDLNDLLSAEAAKRKEILAAGKFLMDAPYFDIEGEAVWGATAMILNEFRVILQEFI
jgi:8-oxo-dGTP pyrophosphatase MutT (NUDIX family)